MKLVTVTSLFLAIVCIVGAATSALRSNLWSIDCGFVEIETSGSDVFVASSLDQFPEVRHLGGPRRWYEAANGEWQICVSLVDAAVLFGGLAFLLCGRLLVPRFHTGSEADTLKAEQGAPDRPL